MTVETDSDTAEESGHECFPEVIDDFHRAIGEKKWVRIVVDMDELLRGVSSYDGYVSDISQTENGEQITVDVDDTIEDKWGEPKRITRHFRFTLPNESEDLPSVFEWDGFEPAPGEKPTENEMGTLIGGGVLEKFQFREDYPSE